MRTSPVCSVLLIVLAGPLLAQEPLKGPDALRAAYVKREVQVPMRDGVKLFASIYSPKDTSRKVPILLRRTPYSCSPYGEDKFPETLGPSELYAREGYVFVYEDVRGRYMSEGEFVNMRPALDKKASPKDVDESSDTYDTIEWLLKNVTGHNGKVGLCGISYPGFYSSAGMIDAHPALAAVSPQAPIADWFYDDFFHHGAFFLPHAFGFFSSFGKPRPAPTKDSPPRFEYGTPDGYQFFLDLGPLGNADARYFKGQVAFWNDIAAHPNYDAFWQARNLLPHLKHVAPAVMTVGGWFDAEDLYGALKTYRAIEAQNPGVFNMLVMGPWSHGGWSRTDGDRLGNVPFGAKTAEFYRKEIELAFFEHYLRGGSDPKLPEAYVFETGANRWRTFDAWPPRGLERKQLYLQAGQRLSFDPPAVEGAFEEYVSDPAEPVPFTESVSTGMTKEYMTDDQRFAARRPDVLEFAGEVLADDLTLAGPLMAHLVVSTTGTDSDWIVKLIDIFPPDMATPEGSPPTQRPLGSYHMMVRSEVIRGRFRNSVEHPEPFVSGQPAKVELELQDVLHTFQKGHRIAVQIQSSWFPLVDRNPQKYVDNIFAARPEDFIRATQRVVCSKSQPSSIEVGVLRAGGQ